MSDIIDSLSQTWLWPIIGALFAAAAGLTMRIVMRANYVNPQSLSSAFGFGHRLEFEAKIVGVARLAEDPQLSDRRFLEWQITIINHHHEDRTVVRSLKACWQTDSIRRRTLATSPVGDASSGQALQMFSVEPLSQSPTLNVIVMIPNRPDIRRAIERETLLCTFVMERIGEPKRPIAFVMKLRCWKNLPWDWDGTFADITETREVHHDK